MPPSSTFRPVAAALAVFALSAMVGCGGGDDAPEAAPKLRVVTTVAPIQQAVERIGGSAVSVTNLTPVGGQPHDLAPTAAADAALKAAKLVITVGPDFQPAVTEAVDQLPGTVARADVLGASGLLPPPEAIRGARGVVEGAVDRGSDPHVWASPKRFIAIVQQLRDALVKADPSRRSVYERQAAAYLKELGVLDGLYRASLQTCDARTLLTTHPAFGYLAADYDLTQGVTAGISTSARPDPRSLAATAAYAKARKVKTLFFAAPVPSRLAKTIKTETGLATATLNPVEGLTQDQIDQRLTYDTSMRENLKQLVDGLGCAAPETGDAETTPATTATTPATTP